MASILRRPILVGGLGLTLLLWLWQSFDDFAGQLDEVGVLGIVAVGGLLLFQKRKSKDNPIQIDLSVVDRAMVENAIAQVEPAIVQLEVESVNHPAIIQLRQRLTDLTTELERKEISVAITGGKAVGKTTLIQLLASSWTPQSKQIIDLKEIPALFTATEATSVAENDADTLAAKSDLVLFVTNGDLTESEFETLKQMRESNQAVVLIFNKEDQYLPEERELVLQQLQQRMQGMVEKEDVLAIATSPKAMKVRQHQVDGTVKEWLEESVPAISPLTERLSQIVAQQRQQLVLATTWRAALKLKAEAKSVLNEARRDRALPVIEQYQWITAAATFANPVPALDLVATGAINAQLIVDLSGIYQQKFSLEQAKTLATTMGSLMLKLGLIELSTQTITSVLKSNAITFVAGGLVQGVSGAYFTRIAGLSLIEYFQEQDAVTNDGENGLNIERLRETLQRVFQQNQRISFLQSFVKQVAEKLTPQASQPQLARAETVVNG